MSKELKPCPHCGGEAELDTSQMYRALSDGELGYRAVVYCTRCGADMGFCYADAHGTPREDIVNQVIDDWNRRAPDPRIALAIEALTALGFGEKTGHEKIGWRGTFPAPTTEAHFRCEFCSAEHLDCKDIQHASTCPVSIARAALSALEASDA